MRANVKNEASTKHCDVKGPAKKKLPGLPIPPTPERKAAEPDDMKNERKKTCTNKPNRLA